MIPEGNPILDGRFWPRVGNTLVQSVGLSMANWPVIRPMFVNIYLYQSRSINQPLVHIYIYIYIYTWVHRRLRHGHNVLIYITANPPTNIMDLRTQAHLSLSLYIYIYIISIIITLLLLMVIVILVIYANLRTYLMDFRGFDSIIILILRGGILMSKGDFPASLSQAI